MPLMAICLRLLQDANLHKKNENRAVKGKVYYGYYGFEENPIESVCPLGKTKTLPFFGYSEIFLLILRNSCYIGSRRVATGGFPDCPGRGRAETRPAIYTHRL